jgi:molybdenum cofactor guanylyltransferase
MQASGFVLAGGGSTRMGRDKALLPYHGTTLVEHVASAVQAASGSAATIIGDPDRYRCFGYPVVADQVPGCGPLSGVYTALSVTSTDWNLVVACDMPAITATTLRKLLEHATVSGRSCVAAVGPSGEPEPLCAVYHRRCLLVLDRAIREKQFKMRDLLPSLEVELWTVDAASVANVNTPAEWGAFQEKPK